MFRGHTPRSVIRYAMRCAITRVLPEPAPARISSGPSPVFTASRCCGFSCERKSVMTMFRQTFKHTICWNENCERNCECEKFHREEHAIRNALSLKEMI